jgi:four helix bundle protein
VSSGESIYLASGNGATPEGFRRLRAWHEAMDLTLRVYGLTHHFPEHEIEALTLQLRQEAVTVPAKIANGSGRGRFSTSEFLDQVSIAASSLARVEALLELALRLAYVAPDDIVSLIDQCAEVDRQLDSLRRCLEDKL